MNKTTNKYTPEVRARAVRMVLNGEGQHESRWAAIVSISVKIGCAPQTLNEWVKKVEVDTGQRSGITTKMAEKMKALERENRELKQANEILRKASACFAPALGRFASQIACRAMGRSSTARSRNDPLYQRSPRGVASGGATGPSPTGNGSSRFAGSCRLPQLLPGRRIA